MDVEGLLDWAQRVLLESDAIDHWQKGRERLEAEELLEHVLGRTFYLDDEMTPSDQARFEKAIGRRATGEPTALIKGFTDFRGLRLIQRPGTFVPRDSSEFLAAQAITRIHRRVGAVVVDMACGTGPVALAVKHEIPKATVYGADLSPDAITVARANARVLRLDVRFMCGNLFNPLPGKFRGEVDVVTLHPPYVGKRELRELPDEIVKFEPTLVLSDGSPRGLGLIERAVAEAPEWLRPGGWLLVEVSPDRARQVMSVMRRGDFRDVRSTVDRGFKVTRVLVGRW